MEFRSSEYQIFFENDLDDDLVQFEIASKGYLYGTVIKITKGDSYREQMNY
ncbi:hypothetical protein [Lysinibacillus sp. NPDC056185]|uniref:hypothetical protein n=1 Tax=Lysinibacillus sp. NPDC056185 TaxID=3345739 RepID=UPI0039EF1FF2